LPLIEIYKGWRKDQGGGIASNQKKRAARSEVTTNIIRNHRRVERGRRREWAGISCTGQGGKEVVLRKEERGAQLRRTAGKQGGEIPSTLEHRMEKICTG